MQILENSTFFLSGVLSFLCITHEILNKIDHLAASLRFLSSVRRGLNNTENVLFGMCFAFMMCSQTKTAHLGSRCFVQRDANNTESVLFTIFFAIVLYGHKAEECNITWPIAHESNRCTFWTSCTGVSLKRRFLSTMRNFGYSFMRILV